MQEEANALLQKGHEIAWDQFWVQKGREEEETPDAGNELVINSVAPSFEIKNDKIALIINAQSGEIQSWVAGGKTITEEPIRPNFWRPPTDNDLGNGMDKWAKIWQEATYQLFR